MVYGMRKAESVLIEKMNFQIADLEPIRSARNCHLPALFIHGEGDDFIPPKHSQMIYKEYGFDEKRLILVLIFFFSFFVALNFFFGFFWFFWFLVYCFV